MVAGLISLYERPPLPEILYQGPACFYGPTQSPTTPKIFSGPTCYPYWKAMSYYADHLICCLFLQVINQKTWQRHHTCHTQATLVNNYRLFHRDVISHKAKPEPKLRLVQARDCITRPPPNPNQYSRNNTPSHTTSTSARMVITVVKKKYYHIKHVLQQACM